MSALQGETPLDMAVRSKNGYIVKSLKKEEHDRGVATQTGFINRLSSSKVGNYRNYTICGRFLYSCSLLHQFLHSYCYIFLPVFGTVDIGQSWYSQVCPRAIWGITTCHKMRHSLSLTTVTHIMARQRPFCTLSRFNSSKWTRDHLCPLAKCSFGMIPLSRHSVDLSPRVFHSSTPDNSDHLPHSSFLFPELN